MWSEREKQRIGERGEKMLIKSAENIENDSKKAGNKKWEEESGWIYSYPGLNCVL